MAARAQTDLLCSNCAGQCAYDPAGRALLCQSCGTAHEIEVDANADPAAETHYHPDLPHTEQPSPDRVRTHQCETCGGRVVFTGAALSEHCPYCNGAVVEVPTDDVYQTLGLIPFQVAKDKARENMSRWIKGRIAAPNDLLAAVENIGASGLYAPFFTLDSTEDIDYTVHYRVKSGKRTYTRTKRGAFRHHFDDLLLPASPHVTPLIRDGILHEFEPETLRPFEPAFLAGFAAERHHVSIKDGIRANLPDKDLLIRNQIKRHSGRSRITSITYKTDTSGIRYRRILLPVWILHYSYGGKPYKVVTCGLHGRTFGERPFSLPKLAMMSGAAASVLTGIGWLWGAAGFL